MHKRRRLLHRGHNAPARAERARLVALRTDAGRHRQVLIELADSQQLSVLYIAITCGRDEHSEFNVPGDEWYRVRGVSLYGDTSSRKLMMDRTVVRSKAARLR
jgi:hypothetical protein